MNLYDVTIILGTLRGPDGSITTEAQVVYGPTTILAGDALTAAAIAGRSITDEQAAAVSRLVVVINPRVER